MSKRKLYYLTTIEKQSIVREIQKREKEGKKYTLQEISNWAHQEFKLEFIPSVATLSRIKRDGEKILSIPCAEGRKRQKATSNDGLDTALAEWVQGMLERRVSLTGDMIKDQGYRIMVKANESLAEGSKLSLKFSNGWLGCFKKRHGFHNLNAKREGEDSGVAKDLQAVRGQLEPFELRDIWTADDFGLFYEKSPKNGKGGAKGANARLVFLVCFNADGSEKMPLLVVGSRVKPEGFGGKTGYEHGFDYYFSKLGALDSELFGSWLKRFDQYIARTPGRKALLLVKSANARNGETALKNVQLVGMSSGSMQPTAAGMVSSLKVGYRTRQMSRAYGYMDEIQSVDNAFYKIDQLTAMRWMRDLWEETARSAVVDCWAKSGIIQQPNGDRFYGGIDKYINVCRRQLAELITDVLPAHWNASVDSLMYPKHEDERVNDTSNHKLAEDVVKSMHAAASEYSTGEGGSNMALGEEMLHLRKAMQVLEARDMCPTAVRNAFYSAQRTMRAEHKKRMSVSAEE